VSRHGLPRARSAAVRAEGGSGRGAGPREAARRLLGALRASLALRGAQRAIAHLAAPPVVLTMGDLVGYGAADPDAVRRWRDEGGGARLKALLAAGAARERMPLGSDRDEEARMAGVTVGRIVLVRLREAGRPRLYNGSDEHPAIVTAVHGGLMINVRVFVDGHDVLWLTSVPHRGQAGPGYGGATWRWPPRAEDLDPTEGAGV